MATTVREIERKYDLRDGVELPGWDGLAGVDAIVGPQEQLEAVYYDTTDLRLLRAGVTLRLRRGGDDAGWHLKLPVDGPAAADGRDEVRVGASPDGRANPLPPAELVALTRVFTRGAPLGPTAQLDVM
jgi:CYTH domain